MHAYPEMYLSVAIISLTDALTFSIKSFLQTECPESVSLEQLIVSLNKSIVAPVDSLPLHAYPVMYLSVAIISLTDGLSGSLFDNIK